MDANTTATWRRQLLAEWREYCDRVGLHKWFMMIFTNPGFSELAEQTLMHLTASEIGFMLDVLGVRDIHCVRSIFFNPLRDIDPLVMHLDSRRTGNFADAVRDSSGIFAFGEVGALFDRIWNSAEYWDYCARPYNPPKVWFLSIHERAKENAAYVKTLEKQLDAPPPGTNATSIGFEKDFYVSGMIDQLIVDEYGPHVNMEPHQPHHKHDENFPHIPGLRAGWLRSVNPLTTACRWFDPAEYNGLADMRVHGIPIDIDFATIMEAWPKVAGLLMYIDITNNPYRISTIAPTNYDTLPDYEKAQRKSKPMLEIARGTHTSTAMRSAWCVRD